MYTPTRFKVSDPEIIRDFIEKNGFGILLSVGDGEIHDTHLPMVLSSDGTHLIGHLAKPNAQWKGWKEQPKVKVIFHGPHTYISPRFYKNDGYVPTWNYTAISISGTVAIVDAPNEVGELIRQLIATYESDFADPYQVDTADKDIVNQLRGVVCFRVEIEEIEAKFKLNQDKPEEDRRSVVAHLKESTDPMSRMVAAMMEKSLSGA